MPEVTIAREVLPYDLGFDYTNKMSRYTVLNVLNYKKFYNNNMINNYVMFAPRPHSAIVCILWADGQFEKRRSRQKHDGVKTYTPGTGACCCHM